MQSAVNSMYEFVHLAASKLCVFHRLDVSECVSVKVDESCIHTPESRLHF